MKEMKNPMEIWLSEYSNDGTRRVSKRRFEVFLKWSEKTPQQLVDEFENKKMRSMILRYQNYLLNELKLSNHTVKSNIGSVRGFFASQCEPIHGLRGKLVTAKRPSQREHQFSTSDLQKMYHIANTRDKAILAVGCSFGWEVSAIRNMKRKFYEDLVKRARDQNLDFVSYWTEREKENEIRLAILNSVTLDALERWLEKTKDSTSEYLWANGNDKPITSRAFNDILKALVNEANIVTIGKIRWHLLRKWLMVTLSNAGFGEWEVKLVVGKAIPSSDMTYLEGLRSTILPKYKQAYPKYLSLVAYSNGISKIESVDQAIYVFGKLLKLFVKKHGVNLDSLGLTIDELNLLTMRLGIKKEDKPKLPNNPLSLRRSPQQ